MYVNVRQKTHRYDKYFVAHKISTCKTFLKNPSFSYEKLRITANNRDKLRKAKSTYEFPSGTPPLVTSQNATKHFPYASIDVAKVREMLCERMKNTPCKHLANATKYDCLSNIPKSLPKNNFKELITRGQGYTMIDIQFMGVQVLNSTLFQPQTISLEV